MAFHSLICNAIMGSDVELAMGPSTLVWGDPWLPGDLDPMV